MRETFPAQLPGEFPYFFLLYLASPPALSSPPRPGGCGHLCNGPLAGRGGVQAEPPQSRSRGRAPQSALQEEDEAGLALLQLQCQIQPALSPRCLRAFFSPPPGGCSLPRCRFYLLERNHFFEPDAIFRIRKGPEPLRHSARGCWQRSTSRFLSARHSPGFLMRSWP